MPQNLPNFILERISHIKDSMRFDLDQDWSRSELVHVKTDPGQDWSRSGLVRVTNGPGSDLDKDNLFENANVKFYLKTTCILFSTYTFQLGFISLRITKLYLRISKPHLEVF